MVKQHLTTTTFYTPVQNGILEVESRMRDISNGHHPDLKSAVDHLLSSGGKRVRPALTLLTGGMLGADRDKLISLAASIELLHTATLVHDDLIDGALLRRGIPTLNSKWSPGATVLTGDFIFACAARLASETESVDLMSLFADTLATIVNGEITQMFPRLDEDYYEAYTNRIYAKTASLFELATTAPSVLSRSSDETREAARSLGYGLGMAFQIIDDVLDFTGKEDAVGKPVANDLHQGLITLPTIFYIDTQPVDKDLQMVISGEKIGSERLHQLVAAIQDSGAIEKSVARAREFVDQAIDALEKLPYTIEHQAMEELANYIVDRRV
jgi:geranylgeranyl pyrophosphate synthase